MSADKKDRKLREKKRVLQKKQPSTGNTIDADITPVAPNFNVVLGSAEHYEQKWLFFSKAAIHIIQSTTCYSEPCVWRPSKKQPFLFIVFGTSKHNIEVGGYGGNVCIYGVSCGWLFFLKNPDSEKHRTAFTPLFASQLPVLFVRADID